MENEKYESLSLSIGSFETLLSETEKLKIFSNQTRESVS